MYVKSEKTCFKYQVHLYGSEASNIWILMYTLNDYSTMSHQMLLQAALPHLYGSVTSSMVKLPYWF